MFIKANILMLPTTDENSANVPFLTMKQKNLLIKHCAGGEYRKLISYGYIPHHLYFTIDERPDVGDYSIDRDELHGPFEKDDIAVIRFDKIIATTDSNILVFDDIKNKPDIRGRDYDAQWQLPHPSELFINQYIEAYNNNIPITECLVEFEEKEGNCSCYYPKFCKAPAHIDLNEKCRDEKHILLKININNEINIKSIKSSWSREEVTKILWKLANGLISRSIKANDKDTEDWIKKNL